jgi:N-dimethylarginine dimethylaminohydrolase
MRMTDLTRSDVLPLRRVLLKHPRDAFQSQPAIAGQWRDLGYLGEPDLPRAVAEYEALIALLERRGVAMDFLPAAEGVGLDSIYVRDAAVTCARGIILCSMGKAQRRGEPAVMGAALAALGLPVLGAISGSGRLEGGDAAWIGPGALLAVGLSRRSNRDGVRQLRELLGADGDAARSGVEILEVPLPDVRVPGDVFHLMSVFSPVADDLALVYPPLLPEVLAQALRSRDVGLVEVPEAEFDTLGCNVLAVAPRVVIAVAGNPQTR